MDLIRCNESRRSLPAETLLDRDLIAICPGVAWLQAAKANGVRLGNPNPLPASRQGIRALQAQTAQYHATVRPLLEQLQQQGYGLAATARELNRRRVPTARGGSWYATTVRNILINR